MSKSGRPLSVGGFFSLLLASSIVGAKARVSSPLNDGWSFSIMAAALVRRTGGLSFLRQSLYLRSLSASVTTPSTSAGDAAAAVDPAKPECQKKKKKKNLFEVAQFLPDWGIGCKMAKNKWRDVSYQITKINLYKDGRHGKAWGIRHKAGLPVADAPVKMSGVNKRGWKYFPESRKKEKYYRTTGAYCCLVLSAPFVSCAIN